MSHFSALDTSILGEYEITYKEIFETKSLRESVLVNNIICLGKISSSKTETSTNMQTTTRNNSL